MQEIKNKTESPILLWEIPFLTRIQNFISVDRLRILPSDLANLCHYFLHDLFIDFIVHLQPQTEYI